MSTTNDSEFSSNGEIATSAETAESLKSRAKRLWLFGEWDALSSLPPGSTENNEDTIIVALLKASALLQLNEPEEAEICIQQALNAGLDKNLAARILIAGAHNTLGRIYSLQKQSDGAKKHFLHAVDIGISDPELIAQSRTIKELGDLGLLPQAVGFIKENLTRVEKHPSQIKNIDAQIKILKSQVELLEHELSLSQQKLQLYRNTAEPEIENNSIGSPAYIEKLRQLSTSQLGQDLWVLEKTNYKRSGFFVEFGATDGVLLSNTYLLEKQFGWAGICAEPNPGFYKKLKNNRNCIVSDACIAGETGKSVEFIFADEYGGIRDYAEADSHAEKRLSFEQAYSSAILATISLDDFLKNNNAPKKIDYLSIDTEGSEYDILKNFPFEKWDIKLISVEHNFTEQREKIFQLLSDFGYKKKESDWDDWYYK